MEDFTIPLQVLIGAAGEFLGSKACSLGLFRDKERVAWEDLAREWAGELSGRQHQETGKALRAFFDLPYVRREMEKVRDNQLDTVNFDRLGAELRKLFETEGAPAPEKAGLKLRRWWRKLEKRIQPEAVNDHQTRRIGYLEAIYDQHSLIEFTGLADGTGTKSARMESLFELPRLQALDERDSKPRKADKILVNASTPPRAILLGKPGAGKTTLLKCLAFAAAAHALEPHNRVKALPELAWAKGLQPLLPVFYRIRALVKDQAKEPLLWRCLYQHAKDTMQLDLPPGFFEREADTGGLLLMFDGLDEAGSPGARNELARRLESFAGGLPEACAVLVSSRPHDYAHQFPKLAHYDLCDLDDSEIESIVRKSGPIYHRDKALADAQANILLAAVKDEAREYLSEMARTALLLAMIVRVHFITGSLPGTRRDLYAKCVDTLLEHWNAELEPGPIPVEATKDFLGLLAYDLQKAAGDGLSSREDTLRVAKDDLSRRLRKFLQTECPAAVDRVDDAVRRLHERDAILVYDTGSRSGEGEAFRFVHRTFQEYFAGTYIVTHLSEQELDDLVERNPPGWNETIYLAIASIGHRPWRERVLLDLLRKNRVLFALEAVKASRGVAQWLDSLIRFLARYYTRDGSGPLVKDVADLCQGNEKALELLDQLFIPANRDARSLASAVELAEALGGRPALTAFRAESKQHGLDTTDNMAWCDGFWMDKYLVTNQDFERMIPGHKAERDGYSDQDNQPVIYANWWEAALYCRWRGQGFRLPSEDEWYKAASWDPAAKKNREYPWGDEWDAAKANTSEADLKRTTPVGAYPNGVSAYGCFDMAGNVWEWTSDVYEGRWKRRVRGGSWGSNRHDAACSARDNDLSPGFRDFNLGFRCSRT